VIVFGVCNGINANYTVIVDVVVVATPVVVVYKPISSIDAYAYVYLQTDVGIHQSIPHICCYPLRLRRTEG
jgi:hypothetical protein